MHGHCEFGHAKACTEVPPLLGHDVDVTFAYLVDELIQLLALQAAEIFGIFDTIQ
jgi:hypothetical protein